MAKIKTCKFCNGTGKVFKSLYSDLKVPCRKCNGKGIKSEQLPWYRK